MVPPTGFEDQLLEEKKFTRMEPRVATSTSSYRCMWRRIHVRKTKLDDPNGMRTPETVAPVN